MRFYLVVAFVLAAGIFSAVVAWRLSPDALALLIGVLVGVLILLPTNAILFLYLRAQSRALHSRPPQASPAPPVVIVQSAQPSLPHMPHPQAPPQLPQWSSAPIPPPRQQERVWEQRVFGAEESAAVESDDYWQRSTR